MCSPAAIVNGVDAGAWEREKRAENNFHNFHSNLTGFGNEVAERSTCQV